jgi:putative ABC transport system permease protein
VISLVLSMIRARWAQALTVWLLSAIATAAAVAGPVALTTVDLAIVRHEVGAATNTERSLSVTAFVNPSDTQTAAQFDTVASLVALRGFESVRAGELEAFGPVTDGRRAVGAGTSRLVFRDRVCDHVVIVEGRCLAGPLEVLVGVDTAARVGLRAGDATVVQAARFEAGAGLVPDGPETRLTVVGRYRPRDPGEPYWGGQRYFPVTSDGTRREALFVNVATFDLIGHSGGQSSVDAFAPPEVLTVDRIPSLPAEIDAVTTPLSEDAQSYSVDTDMPALVDRVERSRRLARQLVPVAFVPLVALCWFVIFLAVASGVFGRRTELGLVTLRGVKPVRRWVLATGETALAILAGAPVGYVLGHLIVGAVARLRLGSAVSADIAGGAGGADIADGAGVSLATLPYAVVALAGALLVGLLGQRATLRAPVVDLLRGVPRRSSAWRGAAAEIVVVVLAVVAVVQLRLAGLTGVALAVPGLVVVAVALIAARLTNPLAASVARRALVRGRLGTGLAALQLARRPGNQRLFLLLAVASAMLSFVAAGVDVAARAREDRAQVATGAARVVTVDNAGIRRLLALTRSVDPAGRWAMAAVPIPQSDPEAPELLAVDTGRLAAVAQWRPEFTGPAAGAGTGPGLDAGGLAAALRPRLGEPFVLRGTRLSLDLATQRLPQDPPLDLIFTFVPLAGGDPIGVPVTGLAGGRTTREIRVGGCAEGCRLDGVSTSLFRGDQLRLTIHSVRQLDPPAEVVPAVELVNRQRWRPNQGTRVLVTSGALQVAAAPSPFDDGEIRVAAVDASLPVPVAAAGSLQSNVRLSSLDGEVFPARLVASPAGLPRLGAEGVLVDLEYLERTALLTPRRTQAEVWLGPAAPADAPERLRRAGLAVSGTTGVDAARRALAGQGPALALHFHQAAAGLGIALALGGLGLVATVDRRRQAGDLRALRRQGLPRRFVRRASLGGYLSTVLTASVAGLLAAATAWAAAGDRVPVFADAGVSTPPRWPHPSAVLLPWAVATGVMVAASVVLAWVLRRSTNRNGGERP